MTLISMIWTNSCSGRWSLFGPYCTLLFRMLLLVVRCFWFFQLFGSLLHNVQVACRGV